MVKHEIAQRLKELPPYLFVEIDKIKKRLKSEGRDLIDLGIGDPDLPTPQEVREVLKEKLKDQVNHQYPLDLGLSIFRAEVSRWFLKRFNVQIDPESEILPLIGSKEGIAHFPLSVINPGDLVLIPEPLYPPYRSGAIFAGAQIQYLPLKEENNFIPDLEGLSRDVLKKTKLLYLNYPNNPTAEIIKKEDLKRIVDLAREFEFIVLYDAAYSELTYDSSEACSILEVEGASEVAIEFHSFSKTYNMTGWRVGWACGNKSLIECLRKVKSNIDSGVFNPVQYAAIEALKIYDTHIVELRSIYRERRDIFIQTLSESGWNIKVPEATFYVWAKIPSKMSSADFSKLLLKECFIIATPGSGFGPSGEGYLRFSLVNDKSRIKEAAERIAKLL
ncbi:MAG: LL-diaminopimelate aminotransferase [Candidatus Kaelpia aquatica]|nr:LL-diaminopimelate aminotransferase [Candidatus Kaelpia aquatica]